MTWVLEMIASGLSDLFHNGARPTTLLISFPTLLVPAPQSQPKPLSAAALTHLRVCL